MLQCGIIRTSSSSCASPLHMVPKMTRGAWRPCGDYQSLNNVTVPDCYPILHIQDFTATLHGATVLSKVDLVRAFDQIPGDPDVIPKTAVTMPFGLFKFLRMPFSLHIATQTFQYFIEQVLQGFYFCYVCLDILIASANHRRTSGTLTSPLHLFAGLRHHHQSHKVHIRHSKVEFPWPL